MTVEVTGVSFKAGNAYLLAGDIEISMSDVIEVTDSNDPETEESSA